MYKDVCAEKGASYFDYASYEVKFGHQDRFEILDKIGRGKYADAYLAVDCETDKDVVLKILKPVKKNRIRREVKVHELLTGGPNIAGLVDVVRDPITKTPALVVEYAPQTGRGLKAWNELSLTELQHFGRELLKALDFVHSKGIIHRDIKPHNVRIDREKRSLKLIDFGQSEFYTGAPLNTRVAAQFFKAPELLIGDESYDFAVDMWAFGALLAGVVFKSQPFFAGKDSLDMFSKIAKVTGSEPLFSWIEGSSAKVDDLEALKSVVGKHPTKDLSKLVSFKNEALATEEAIDLISKLLVVDPAQRLTAKAALEHPFFQ